MTEKEINEQLIKEVETAVNNVANAYNGAFKIKKSDEGTDRVSNFTLRLTSSEWNKDAAIKFSIDKPSEYLGDPDDPMYYAGCEMGMRVNKYDGFVGEKHNFDISGKPMKVSVGSFIENLFLPSSIEILKFAKDNKKELKRRMFGAEWAKFKMRLRDFYMDMWKGTIKKVPTEEQISQLFYGEDIANESELVGEAAGKSSHQYPTEYALEKYLEILLTDGKHGNFPENKVYVLSLDPEKSTFNSFKAEIAKVFGRDALNKKKGIFHYFILFNGMEKEEILEKLADFPNTGDTWDASDIVDVTRGATKRYLARFEFKDDVS